MAKGTTGRRAIGSRQHKARPFPLPSINESIDSHLGDCHEIIVKKDWVDATCKIGLMQPVAYAWSILTMLFFSHVPLMTKDAALRYVELAVAFLTALINTRNMQKSHYHNMVNLVMTTEGLAIGPLSSWNMDKSEVLELPCLLCRSQVKGWTVVKPAREYLNTKKRNCMQENCSYVGVYKELRKHVRVDHPSARPHKVDPLLEQKWSRLEHERERDDVISTIRSSMPGSVFFGDYVIEANGHVYDSDEEENFDANIMELNEDFNNGIDRIEKYQ